MQPLITKSTELSDYSDFKYPSSVSSGKWCGILNDGIKFLVSYDSPRKELHMRGESGSIKIIKQKKDEIFNFSEYLWAQEKAYLFSSYQEGLFWLSGYSTKVIEAKPKKKSIWRYLLDFVASCFAIPFLVAGLVSAAGFAIVLCLWYLFSGEDWEDFLS